MVVKELGETPPDALRGEIDPQSTRPVLLKTGLLPRQMSRELNRAFEKRQLGDYESVFVLSEDEAREILEKARAFTGACVAYLKETGNL